jgi:large subunit ribosomal protein L6
MRALIGNAVKGVTKGFEKRLEIVGIGYRAELQDGALKLLVGLSHPVVVPAPETIEFAVEAPTSIGGIPVTVVAVKGIDKELVGRVAAHVRGVKPPEPYKGKGIKYSDENVRRKAGKAAAAG